MTIKKNLGLYLIFAIYGVLNRETGLLLMIIYPLINYKESFYFVPVLVIPSVFFLFNYDLFFQKEFYKFNAVRVRVEDLMFNWSALIDVTSS